MFKETLIYTFLTTIVLLIAYIFDVLLEMSLFIIYYYFIKGLFVKQFHADTIAKSPQQAVKLCFTITFLTQLIFIFLLVSFNLSYYINIYLGVALGLFSYILQDYLEHKVKKIKFYKGMSAEDIPVELVGIEYEVIYQYYVKRLKLDTIAYNLNYSYDNINKIKAKIIRRYS